MLFPALALPTAGEKDFVCPKQHLAKAVKFFTECKNFLFVGFSGLDPHVLDLFTGATAIERLVIVNGSKDADDMLFAGLSSVNGQFKTTHLWRSAAVLFDGGFRAFMESTDFDKLIS